MKMHDQVNITISRNPEETQDSSAKDDLSVCGDQTCNEESDDAKGAKQKSRNSSERSKEEKVCRICHFGNEQTFAEGSEIIRLGCDCRGDLGVSHRHCADLWFHHKGNRLCEICGMTAKHIRSNNEEETSILMMELNEMLAATTLDSSHERSRRCKKAFCHFLLTCLVLAFVLPWFFVYI